MSLAALASVVALASFALVSGAAALLARHARSRPRAASDARALFIRAVGPTVASMLITATLLLPSFLRHESPRGDEWPGALLMALALAGTLRLATVATRGFQALRASRALVQAWLRGATPLPLEPWGLRASKIDAGFPVVAVAGLFRPHVFVDRRVLDACSPGELAAVAAHERAHVASRDNLRRLMIAACAGYASQIAVAWRAAAERAADEGAAQTPGAAAELAAALVRVARAAPPSMLPIAAVSTINDGGSLEVRVRRLLAFTSAERERDQRTWPLTAGACAALAGLMLASPLPKVLHAGLELLVQRLP